MQRACGLGHLETAGRAHHSRGGAPVGPADEAIPVQPAEIPADGHLGDTELAREGAHLDRLVGGDPLQHLDAPLDRQHWLSPECSFLRLVMLVYVIDIDSFYCLCSTLASLGTPGQRAAAPA